MNEQDKVRLGHMLEAARAAVGFIQGRSRESLEHDLQLIFALVRAVQIIGEAANKVSKEGKAKFPQIPWSDMIGMRNILVHDYFNINLDVLWGTVTHSLPPLIAELEKIIP